MTDKKKIRKEVQRLQNELIQEREKGFSSDIDDACILELQNVLTYIDSLQEEPVNRTPADIESAMQEVEEKSMAFTEAHQGEDTDTILAQMRGEEPISEDLEEAAWLYYDKNRLPIPPEWDLHKEFIDFFKAGAKWKKKQMLKNAISAELYSDGMFTPLIGVKDKEKLKGIKFGDKVKLIIKTSDER